MGENLIDPGEWEMFKTMADPATLVELLDAYLTDSPDLIEQMHTGLAGGDINLVRRAAHSLKSNSASFGANRLASASRELEMLVKQGTLDDASSKLVAIEAEFALLKPLLEKYKNEFKLISHQ